MKTYNSKLYFGGPFSQLIPEIYSVTCWDGNSYERIFERSFWGYTIMAMEVFNNELYFGGHTLGIVKFGGDTIDYAGIYKYDETDCYDVGQANMLTVRTMTVDTFNNFLYVAGDFVANVPSCPNNLYKIAKWDGYKWYNLLGGTNDGIGGLKMYRGELYAAGGFTLAGGKSCSGIARWIGNEWFPLDTNVTGEAYPMEVFDDELYVGGLFVNTQTTDTFYLGRWYMPPDTTCNYLQPIVHSLENGALQDTFYIINDTVTVQFYNNNAYVDSWSWNFGDLGTANTKDPNHIYTDTGIYNVELIVTHGSCVDTANTTLTVLLGTGMGNNEIKEIGFKLYPNPTTNTLFVEMTPKSPKGDLKNKNLQIIDIKGKVVLSTSLRGQSPKQSVDISDLPNGVYFVKIGKQTERFVKE